MTEPQVSCRHTWKKFKHDFPIESVHADYWRSKGVFNWRLIYFVCMKCRARQCADMKRL